MNEEYEEFVELGLNILVNFVGNLRDLKDEDCRVRGLRSWLKMKFVEGVEIKNWWIYLVLLNFVSNLGDLRGWGIYVWRVEIKIGWELSEWRKQFVHVTV